MRRPAVSFIFLTLVLDILGIGLIIPVLPELVDRFHGGSAAEASRLYGLLASVYALMQFLFAPVLGSLSDRFGRRPVILISLLGAGLDYFLLASANSLPWFFVGRVIAGITGANFSAAYAYIADVSPPEKRAANFGLVGAAFGLGFIIGPALGGILSKVGQPSHPELGLRLPFVVAGVLTLLNWLYGCFVLPESLAPENRRAFSLAKANPVGSLIDLSRHPMLIGFALAFFVLGVAHQVYPSTWALYTKHRYGWSPEAIGWSLAAVGVCAALVQGGLTRRVTPRIGEHRAVLLGVLFSTAAYLGYGCASAGWMVYPLIAIGAIGGLTNPALQALVSRGVGQDEQGAIQGALSSLTSLSGIAGPFLATSLFGHFAKTTPAIPGAAFFGAAILNLLGLAIAFASMRKVLAAPPVAGQADVAS